MKLITVFCLCIVDVWCEVVVVTGEYHRLNAKSSRTGAESYPQQVVYVSCFTTGFCRVLVAGGPIVMLINRI